MVVCLGLLCCGLFVANAASRSERLAGSCPSGAKPAIVAGNFKCLSVGAKCAPRSQAVYRRYGFSCLSGRLHKYVKPHPTPTTTVVVVTTQSPPTPVFQSGHYVGTTSQFQPISFDVADGQIENVTSGDVNGSCNPQFDLFGGQLNIPQWPINGDGSFNVTWSYTGTLTSNSGGSAPYNATTVFTGHVQGASASGTLREDSNFDLYSVGYVCSSGLLTWTATLSQ